MSGSEGCGQAASHQPSRPAKRWLLLGDGDLSNAVALHRHLTAPSLAHTQDAPSSCPHGTSTAGVPPGGHELHPLDHPLESLVATVWEGSAEVLLRQYPSAAPHLQYLRLHADVVVQFGVDATSLPATLPGLADGPLFDCVVFLFPFDLSVRKSRVDRQRTLLRRMLAQMPTVLARGGQAMVALKRGQGGTPFEDGAPSELVLLAQADASSPAAAVVGAASAVSGRPAGDSWHLLDACHDAGLVLHRVEWFVPRWCMPPYQPVGRRQSTAAFCLDNAVMHSMMRWHEARTTLYPPVHRQDVSFWAPQNPACSWLCPHRWPQALPPSATRPDNGGTCADGGACLEAGGRAAGATAQQHMCRLVRTAVARTYSEEGEDAAAAQDIASNVHMATLRVQAEIVELYNNVDRPAHTSWCWRILYQDCRGALSWARCLLLQQRLRWFLARIDGCELR